MKMSKNNNDKNALLKAVKKQEEYIKRVTKTYAPIEKFNNLEQRVISTTTLQNSINSKIQALNSAITPTDTFIQSYQPIELFAKQQQFFDYINKINEIYRPLIPQTTPWFNLLNLVYNGWVIPINKKEFSQLCSLSDIDDDTIIEIYERNSAKLLKEIQTETIEELHYNTPKKQFNDAIVCYKNGLYFSCIASLAPIIEGIIEDKENPRKTNIKMLFNKATVKISKRIEKNPYIRLSILLKDYLEEIYAKDSDFSKDDPDFINRHWIAHGRYKTKEMTKVDCLKLFSALYAMIQVVRFCKELETTE